jgi:hypothetical protein
VKIKIVDTIPGFAVNYYRGFGAFSMLKKITSNIQVDMLPITDWFDLIDYDLIYMERPQSKEYPIIEYAEAMGLKIWVDYDDDLINIPPYSAQVRNANEMNVRLTDMKKALMKADIVTVSTEMLKSVLGPYNPRTFILPNAFNDYEYALSSHPSNNNYIMWRGGQTHEKDISTMTEAILKSAINNPEWLWYFFGSFGYEVLKIMDALYDWHSWMEPSAFMIPNMLLTQYFEILRDVSPSIMYVPLEFIPFNMSKSNIAWIEATYAGACCLGPDMPEWDRPGIEVYKNPDDFIVKADMLMKNPEERLKNFNKSANFIKQNLCLSKVNKKRLELLKEVLK